MNEGTFFNIPSAAITSLSYTWNKIKCIHAMCIAVTVAVKNMAKNHQQPLFAAAIQGGPCGRGLDFVDILLGVPPQ